MENSVNHALAQFSQRYIAAYQAHYQHLPKNDSWHDWPSPCVQEIQDQAVLWRPVAREHAQPLSAVEQGMELKLHSDIHAFYASQWSGDLPAQWRDLPLTLLQIWNEEDEARLQENLLGHLVMQRRLKHSPSLFIATTEDEMTIITLCNLTGNIAKETLGSGKKEILSVDLCAFLAELEPRVE